VCLFFEFLFFVSFVCLVSVSSGTLLLLLGFVLSLLFLFIMVQRFSSLFLLVLIYLFCGGILSVLAFFVSYLWSPLFSVSSLVLTSFTLFVFSLMSSSKFVGSGVLEVGSCWDLGLFELSFLVLALFLRVLLPLVVLHSSSGSLRSFEIWSISLFELRAFNSMVLLFKIDLWYLISVAYLEYLFCTQEVFSLEMCSHHLRSRYE